LNGGGYVRSFPNPADKDPFPVGCSSQVHHLTKRLGDKDEDDEVISDWKFAAMVIDRFCLLGLTLYTILTTVILFLSAPHVIVP
jgi:hypothetical protein